jgi:hypothetical protein
MAKKNSNLNLKYSFRGKEVEEKCGVRFKGERKKYVKNFVWKFAKKSTWVNQEVIG